MDRRGASVALGRDSRGLQSGRFAGGCTSRMAHFGSGGRQVREERNAAIASGRQKVQASASDDEFSRAPGEPVGDRRSLKRIPEQERGVSSAHRSATDNGAGML